MDEIRQIREAEREAELLIQNAAEEGEAEISQAHRDVADLIRKKREEAQREIAKMRSKMGEEALIEEKDLLAGAEEERDIMLMNIRDRVPVAVSHIRNKIYGASDVLSRRDE